MRRHFTFTRLLITTLTLVLGALAPAWGQGTDTEPNNTCPTAQVFGAVGVEQFLQMGRLEVGEGAT